MFNSGRYARHATLLDASRAKAPEDPQRESQGVYSSIVSIVSIISIVSIVSILNKMSVLSVFVWETRHVDCKPGAYILFESTLN